LQCHRQTADEYLRDLCFRRLIAMAKLTKSFHRLSARLDYELSVIAKMGWPSYFLIVADFISWAKNNKIVVGPGRGSAPGSLVCYLTGITNLDPLEYDLLFERFLNPDRISMPDMIWFRRHPRDEVINMWKKVQQRPRGESSLRHGQPRAAIRDIGGCWIILMNTATGG
jgi:DNA polymerase-3 subunit alpha